MATSADQYPALNNHNPSLQHHHRFPFIAGLAFRKHRQWGFNVRQTHDLCYNNWIWSRLIVKWHSLCSFDWIRCVYFDASMVKFDWSWCFHVSQQQTPVLWLLPLIIIATLMISVPVTVIMMQLPLCKQTGADNVIECVVFR